MPDTALTSALLMSKTITIELSQKSVQNAINELRQYRRDLEARIGDFLSRLADVGIEVVHATMDSVPPNDRGEYIVVPDTSSPLGIAIKLTGNKILFVEFGAGVLYSNPQNPKAGEMGMGVGTYPGQRYAWNLTQWGGGWWYTDRQTGESVHSFGNPAYMPMYKAEQEILERVYDIATDVFR